LGFWRGRDFQGRRQCPGIEHGGDDWCSAAIGAISGYPVTGTGTFLQDHWSVTPHLTVGL
jgi:hypothetical protein